jgi:hypothetical protein
MTIKAIETYYKGYRFRSRLEARWAVFFDALGIKYQYEPQGFRISNRYPDDGGPFVYLPDFYLPGCDIYVEVKGQIHHQPLLDQIVDCLDFGNLPGRGLILVGNLPNHREMDHHYDIIGHEYFFNYKAVYRSTIFFQPGGPSRYIGLSESCDGAHRYDCTFGHPVRCSYSPTGNERMIPHDAFDGGSPHSWCDDDPTLLQPYVFDGFTKPRAENTWYRPAIENYSDYVEIESALYSAYDKARQARFEHGERG